LKEFEKKKKKKKRKRKRKKKLQEVFIPKGFQDEGLRQNGTIFSLVKIRANQKSS